MFFDEPEKPKTKEFPARLDALSVKELEEYIADLKAEIERAQADITKKQSSRAAADAFFKT
jgi:uncharacterized small protein (DUF1192 family)